jgi:signal transduction histidine kinase
MTGAQIGEERRSRMLEILHDAGFTSYMAVPLTARGHLVGLMFFVSAHEERQYGPEDVVLAEALASRAATAVDNAQLYEEAQRALSAREEFLLIASHELRTPLSSLSMAVQALLKQAQAAHTSEALLRPVERSTVHLIALADDLLDVSRFTAGAPSPDREHVDLGAVVAGVTDEMADVLQRAGCVVRWRADGATDGDWDRRWLVRITTNLLSNAAKYGKGGPIDVDLAGDLDTVRLTVRDHGIGIPLEEQTRIFERFERAVSVRHYGGFGLGLWIVRRMVEALGGVVRVESRPNEGATFVVELPRRAPT